MAVTAQHEQVRSRNRRGEGDRLREEIVAAAAELVEESGDSDQVTLRGVAKRIGIAAPSIYRHFSTVEDLKLAVVERAFREFARERDAQRPDVDDPAEELMSGCRSYCRFAVEHPGPYRFMFSHASPANGRQSSAGLAAFSRLTDSIRRCQEAGRADTAKNPSELASHVWATLHGLALLRINAPEFDWPGSLDEMAHLAVSRLVCLTSASDHGSSRRRPKERK